MIQNYDIYLRLPDVMIESLNDVLDGENGFDLIGLVESSPSFTIEKGKTKSIKNKEHVFTEIVKLEFESFETDSGTAELIFDKYNNQNADVCYKCAKVGSVSPFLANAKCFVVVNVLANDVSSVKIKCEAEAEDSSDIVTFFTVIGT